MEMHLRLSAILAAVVVLAGCAARTDGPDASSHAAATPTPAESADPPDVATRPPSRPANGGADLTGRLGADAVEGGCAYLETDDGARYEVIYPDGWSLRTAPLELRDPDGEVVARGGDTITVRGTEAGDMASFCMIGPIFRATEVVSVED